MDRKGLCNEDCNHCPIINGGIDKNHRLLTFILNKAYNKFGNDFYRIVQEACPNLTCCSDCHIDDFCHVEGCEIIKRVKQSDLETDAEDKEAT